MSRTRCVASLVASLAACPVPAVVHAQIPAASVELFGTVGAIAGLTPVAVASGSRVAGHAGVRIDGGLQFPRMGVGVGARYWEMAPTNECGGAGGDVLLIGEWRPGNSLHTTVRGAFGTGFGDFDSGHGPSRPDHHDE